METLGLRVELGPGRYLPRRGIAMSTEPRPRQEFDVDNLTLKLDITMPADVKLLGPYLQRIMAVVKSLECAAGKEFEIELALNEALANAIKHGCKGDTTKSVRVSVECDPKAGMLLVVRDPGEGFAPEELPSPLIGERLFASHGRGIYLINKLMDEVRIEGGGTEIWMRKKY